MCHFDNWSLWQKGSSEINLIFQKNWFYFAKSQKDKYSLSEIRIWNLNQNKVQKPWDPFRSFHVSRRQFSQMTHLRSDQFRSDRHMISICSQPKIFSKEAFYVIGIKIRLSNDLSWTLRLNFFRVNFPFFSTLDRIRW